MTEVSYADRVASQIRQYADTVDMHALPDSFHFWSNSFIRPGLEAVFGTASINEAYALAFVEARQGAKTGGEILSVACGDGGVEIEVCKILRDKGFEGFRFSCTDLSPILLEHCRAAVEREQLTSYFEIIETDINNLALDRTFDMVMANHSLHHILELERLFSYIAASLTEHGIFATCDMIGRNGHMRWPETAAIVRSIWPTLTERQRFQVQLKRFNETFQDHDCSTEGFEGIRAQDILPLILKDFHSYKFMGAGGFIDLLVDRGYGHGFDCNVAEDKAKVKMVADINEMMLDAKIVKPTWMMAYFTRDDRSEIFYRDRRAIDCLRDPNLDPRWTRFYA